MERVPRSIAERRVFIDTSAFLAITDRTDRHHQEARAVSARLLRGRYRLLTTMYVLVETHATILRAMNASVARQFLDHGLDETTLLAVRTKDEEQARLLILRRTDKDYSFCDAISFVVMERQGIFLAFAYDDHFRQHGFSTPVGQDTWP